MYSYCTDDGKYWIIIGKYTSKTRSEANALAVFSGRLCDMHVNVPNRNTQINKLINGKYSQTQFAQLGDVEQTDCELRDFWLSICQNESLSSSKLISEIELNGKIVID